MNTTNILNLSQLPAPVRQQLIDYYYFLLNKYGKLEQQEETTGKVDFLENSYASTGFENKIAHKEKFFAHVEQQRFTLPADYKFDRDWANER